VCVCACVGTFSPHSWYIAETKDKKRKNKKRKTYGQGTLTHTHAPTHIECVLYFLSPMLTRTHATHARTHSRTHTHMSHRLIQEPTHTHRNTSTHPHTHIHPLTHPHTHTGDTPHSWYTTETKEKEKKKKNIRAGHGFRRYAFCGSDPFPGRNSHSQQIKKLWKRWMHSKAYVCMFSLVN
jgi:hypothetical protein